MFALRSASVFASWTALSRLLGFVRDILLAVTLGATAVADAFLFAYRFPHLFRNLLAEGAMASSLVPVYQKRRQQEQGHAQRSTHQYFSGSLLLSLFATTLTLSVALAVFMPSVVATLAEGFLAVEKTFRLTVDLSRIAIFYLPLVATTALLCHRAVRTDTSPSIAAMNSCAQRRAHRQPATRKLAGCSFGNALLRPEGERCLPAQDGSDIFSDIQASKAPSAPNPPDCATEFSAPTKTTTQ